MDRLLSVVTVVVVVTVSACGGSHNPLAPGELPAPIGGGQACRSYAVEWTTTSDSGPATTSSAKFTAADRTYREFSPAGSAQLVRRTIYNSVADFVDETAVMGRLLYEQTDECQPNGCLSAKVNSYDGQRRVTRVNNLLTGVLLSTEIYSAWDNLGRHTAGTLSQSACDLPISLAYDDASRTVSVTPTGPGTGAGCLLVLFGPYFPVQSFDADGNLIRYSAAAGGTGTTQTHTVTATDRVCK
jgi:hypothetical protein